MVAVNGRSSLTVSDLVGRHHRAIAAPGDVSCPSGAKTAVDAALADMGGLDLLVCNVGGGDSVQPGKETPEEWQRVFALNLWSTTNVVEAARHALADGGGSVVCISSICGSTVVEGAPLTYSVAKAALHAYVRGIAATLASEGVRINAVALGNVIHEGSVWERRSIDDPEGVEALLREGVPVGRFGTPEEVAGLVAWLGSDRAGFATGSVWTFDGGQARL